MGLSNDNEGSKLVVAMPQLRGWLGNSTHDRERPRGGCGTLLVECKILDHHFHLACISGCLHPEHTLVGILVYILIYLFTHAPIYQPICIRNQHVFVNGET